MILYSEVIHKEDEYFILVYLFDPNNELFQLAAHRHSVFRITFSSCSIILYLCKITCFKLVSLMFSDIVS